MTVKAKNRKTRITVEFPSEIAADAWLASIKMSGHLPDNAVAWPMDALDSRNGVKEYLVRGDKEARVGTPLKGEASAMAMFDAG